MSIKMRKCNTSKGDLHSVIEAPDGPKGTLLFLHGFPDNATVWEKQIEAFKSEYKIIAPCLPGTWSGDNLDAEVPRLDPYVDMLMELVDKEKVGDLHVVGHDLGGPVAGRIAQRFPDKVKSLIFLNSLTLEQFWYRKKYLSQWMKSYYIFLFQVPLVPKLTLMLTFDSGFKKAMEKAGAPKDSLKMQQGPEVLNGLDQYRQFFKELPRVVKGKDEKINTRTLFIWGAEDPFLNVPTDEELESQFTNYMIEIKSASHWIFLSNPEMVNESIGRFIHE